jgi:hypothetical protein
MHDEVSHFGVVDGTLRFRFPGSIGAGVVRIDTDDVEPVEVAKLHARYAFQLTTEDEMEQLLCWQNVGGSSPSPPTNDFKRLEWKSTRATDRNPSAGNAGGNSRQDLAKGQRCPRIDPLPLQARWVMARAQEAKIENRGRPLGER